MAQTSPIIETLKSLLKSHSMTYKDVAQGLELSEASVKRLFAEQTISLQRLDQICQLIGIEISDLIKAMESQQYQLKELTQEQEEELVAEVKLLLVAFVVINGWTFEEILQWYELSETETVRYLVRLDRLKMIDLLPNNRIRLKIAANFSWRRNGPIQKFFSQHLQAEFLKNRFDKQEETLQFPSGLLSRASCDLFNRRIKQLIQEFHTLNEQDRSLPLSERVGYSLLLAFRPWRPSIFEQIRRKDI